MTWTAVDPPARPGQHDTRRATTDRAGTIPVDLFAVARVLTRLCRRFRRRANGIMVPAVSVGVRVVPETRNARSGSFQVADGIILLPFPLAMRRGTSRLRPAIAAGNRDPERFLHRGTATLLILARALTLRPLLAVSIIDRMLGETGSFAISRVMGIVLATIVADAIAGGFDVFSMADIASAPDGNPLAIGHE
ncbi:hypothetical protein [Paracoccus sp. Ld10]|uniref:hypothetical protein n=1 Tax=Paracoccus sp. Ld10 TaxID=649158 RepID=UPI00386F7A6F